MIWFENLAVPTDVFSPLKVNCHIFISIARIYPCLVRQAVTTFTTDLEREEEDGVTGSPTVVTGQDTFQVTSQMLWRGHCL